MHSMTLQFTGNLKKNIFITLKQSYLIDICSWSTVTDAVVKWEPFTVAGSQSGEIMVINSPDDNHSNSCRTPDVCGMHTRT